MDLGVLLHSGWVRGRRGHPLRPPLSIPSRRNPSAGRGLPHLSSPWESQVQSSVCRCLTPALPPSLVLCCMSPPPHTRDSHAPPGAVQRSRPEHPEKAPARDTLHRSRASAHRGLPFTDNKDTAAPHLNHRLQWHKLWASPPPHESCSEDSPAPTRLRALESRFRCTRSPFQHVGRK